MTAPAVEAVFPQTNPYANYAGSCQQSVKKKSCSLQSLSDVYDVYVVYHTKSENRRVFASLRVQAWVPSRFKTPHPLSETPSPRQQQHKGSSVLPVVETEEKIRDKNTSVRLKWQSLRYLLRIDCRHQRITLLVGKTGACVAFKSAPKHSRSSSRTHACPHCAFAAAAVKLITFHTEVSVRWIPTVLYNTVMSSLVQDQLCGGQNA